MQGPNVAKCQQTVNKVKLHNGVCLLLFQLFSRFLIIQDKNGGRVQCHGESLRGLDYNIVKI